MPKNYYWIKLYYDLLDDYKVGNLPDGLKWRFIQCLLMAGELREGGFLPPLEEMAFRIRPITPESLNDDLARLAKPGLVELKVYKDHSERWFVTKFEERQKASDAAMRMREYRKRKKAEKEKSPKPPKEKEEDKITDTDNIPYRNARYDCVTIRNGTEDMALTTADVYTAYENAIGPLNKISTDMITDDCKEYGIDRCHDAIKEAEKNGGRSWAYVRKILENWQQNGKVKPGPNKHQSVKRLLSLVKKYSRKGAEAKRKLSKDEWAIVEKMGGWYHVCMMSEEQIKIKYFTARKEVAYG